MSQVKIKDILSALPKNQIIQIFVAFKDDVYLKAYKNVDKIPKKLYNLYINYIATGTMKDIYLQPKSKEQSELVMLIDAYYYDNTNETKGDTHDYRTK